jgi:hypothetical protein
MAEAVYEQLSTPMPPLRTLWTTTKVLARQKKSLEKEHAALKTMAPRNVAVADFGTRTLSEKELASVNNVRARFSAERAKWKAFANLPAKPGWVKVPGGNNYEKIATDKDFDLRRARFGAPKSNARAAFLKASRADLAEGTTYRGSDPLQMPIKRKGMQGIRVAGHQWLRDVDSGTGATAAGSCLSLSLLNPIALGGRLTQLGTIFEQCKFNHCMVVYRPLRPATDAGQVCAYYRADTSTDLTETGDLEFQAASGHANFMSTSVWQGDTLEIDPQNMNVRYPNQFTGQFSDDVQGMIKFISGGSITGGIALGVAYLEYDCEFYSPDIDYSVPVPLTGIMVLKANAYIAMATGGIVVFQGTADAAGVVSMTFNTPPPTDEYLVLFWIKSKADGANAANLVWKSNNNTDDDVFEAGQAFVGRFWNAGVTNWTDAGTRITIYRDIDSASGVVSIDPDNPSDGQLTWVNTNAAPATTTMECEYVLIPLNPSAS